MEVDVVVVFIDGALLAFSGFLTGVTGEVAVKIRLKSSLSRARRVKRYSRSHHLVLFQPAERLSQIFLLHTHE